MKKYYLLLTLCLLVSCGTKTPNANEDDNPEEEVVNYNVSEVINYANSSNNSQLLQMYTPKNASEATPVAILIHGGMFRFGDVNMFSTTAKNLANMGIAVACVDYRKVPDNIFPDAVSDIKAAVRYVRANAETYNIDPDRIITWGESAGAYLSVMAALTGNLESLNGDVETYTEVSSKVNLCIDFYGPMDVRLYQDSGLCSFLGIEAEDVEKEENSDVINRASPSTYINKETNPELPYFIIEHGSVDSTVNNNESKYLYDLLVDEYGESQATFTIIEGAAHMDKAFYTVEHLTNVVNQITSYFATVE